MTRIEATIEAELMQVWLSKGIDPQSLVPDPRGTLQQQDALADGAALSAWGDEVIEGRATVELGAVIGRGGVGVVREAVQAELRRQVAVKELRPEVAQPHSIAALLREAWVSGSLEHPNVVPIHALVPGDAGPRLVMKRVEGQNWSSLVHSGPDPEVALERDLQILRQVCHAVHFAHSRGVLHLDLKPANVMIGSFGEVYLVDWGLAAALHSDGPPWLPRAHAIASVCGTPSYAAPELAAGDGARIGITTDVYGLGALLHEILAGRTRHSGKDLYDVLAAAFVSEPVVYGEDVPRELAAIANRATARDPAARHASAEDFRVAIEGFLGHRASSRLSDDAENRLARLRASRPSDEGQAQRALNECRFLFEQALALWSENPLARQRVREIEAELASREAEVAALKRLEHESDGNFNRLSRSKLAGISGGLWVLWNFGSGIAVRDFGMVIDYPKLWASAAGTIAIYITGMILFRKTLATTAVNRSILQLFGAFFGVTVLSWAGAGLAGFSPMQAIANGNAIYVAFGLALAFFVDRRCLAPSLVISPVIVIGPALPELCFEVAAVAGGILGFWLAWIWRRPIVSPLTGKAE